MSNEVKSLADQLAARFPTHLDDAGRRAWLRRAIWTLAGSLVAPAFAGRPSGPRARFQADPFSLGVASGYPSTDSVVLWTRLAPQPLNGGGLEAERVQVAYEVAEDAAFKRIVSSAEVRASGSLAHSVHVEPRGLRPGREYFYRFFAGDAVSRVGRVKTAPADGPDLARFAVTTCQHFEQGYFAGYQQMLREDPDLILHVGDYIYEVSWGDDLVRAHAGGKCMTLDDFRNRHAQYKLDPDLQAAHAHCPWLLTWDDHEVENDYADGVSETLDPNFLLRRAFAYQAYYENMPVPRRMLPHGPDMRIYDAIDYGSLLRFHILDTRQYRSPQACPAENRHGSSAIDDTCAERLDPNRSMLGAAQERWLEASFAGSKARWNVIVQTSLFAPERQGSTSNPTYFSDGWDGYPAARKKVLDAIQRHALANPIVVGGDVHAHYVSNVRADPADERSAVLASDFCSTSLSAQGNSQVIIDQRRALNPDILLSRSDTRGFQVHEVNARQLKCTLHHTLDEKVPDGKTIPLAVFQVDAGKPGIKTAT